MHKAPYSTLKQDESARERFLS